MPMILTAAAQSKFRSKVQTIIGSDVDFTKEGYFDVDVDVEEPDIKEANAAARQFNQTANQWLLGEARRAVMRWTGAEFVSSAAPKLVIRVYGTAANDSR
jgi:hypothetical protein